MATVHFAIGDTSTDFKTGSPNISISGDTATISVSQAGQNIGVGCVIDYDTDNKKAYIVEKVSGTTWKVKTNLGANCGDLSGVAVNSIKRVFASIRAAVNGAPSSSGLYAKLGNSSDLVTLQLFVILQCYGDAVDTNPLNISTDWTVSSSYRIRIQAPKNTSTEVNFSQRTIYKETGDNSRAYIQRATGVGDYESSFGLCLQFTEVEGLRIEYETTGHWGYEPAIGTAPNFYIGSGVNLGCDTRIEKNFIIMKGRYDGVSAIQMDGWGNNQCHRIRIFRNVIIGYSAGSPGEPWIPVKGCGYGISHRSGNIGDASKRSFVYNNTVFGSFQYGGIYLEADVYVYYMPFVKNNYSYMNYNSAPCFAQGSSFDKTQSYFAYNFSDDTTAGTANGCGRVLYSNGLFISVSSGSRNLRYFKGSPLQDVGVGISVDSVVPTPDADEVALSGSTCDIGAFEAVPAFSPKAMYQYKIRRG